MTDDQKTFWVEFVYLSPGTRLEDSGIVTAMLPQFDIPISRLFVSLYLPQGYLFLSFILAFFFVRFDCLQALTTQCSYKYKDFKTELDEVDYFSSTVPQVVHRGTVGSLGVINSYSAPPPPPQQQQQRVQRAPQAPRSMRREERRGGRNRQVRHALIHCI